MSRRRSTLLKLSILLVLLAALALIGFNLYGLYAGSNGDNLLSAAIGSFEKQPEFSGERALELVEYQVSLGPRLPDSDAHDRIVAWMVSELENVGWQVELQETTFAGQPIRNVIAKRGEGSPWTVLGAHYDSRIYADRDPDPALHSQAVPGANDGASGVAVLLELARALPEDLQGQVWLVFFDAEDNGDIPGWDWILGSQAFVAELERLPDKAVIVDMVGDADLRLPIETNSSPELVGEIWAAAEAAGYGHIFVDEPGRGILDDHTPFLQAGVQAVDIIDFTYPYWHTTADTPDKVSAASLGAVGNTLLHWLTTP